MSTYTVKPGQTPKSAAKGPGVRANLIRRALAEAVAQHSQSPLIADALAKHISADLTNR